MRAYLDHIVIASPSLEAGREFIEKRLNVAIPYGGEHQMMGTHNHVMPIGGGVYLEVIAINPAQRPPERPRWFGLDDPYVRQQLEQGPRILTWAVNTPDISEMLNECEVSLGVPVPMQRGELKWMIGVPEDGHLPASGFLPHVIEWENESPVQQMSDPGFRLKSFAIYHPRVGWLNNHLAELGLLDVVTTHSTDQLPFFEIVLTNAEGKAVTIR